MKDSKLVFCGSASEAIKRHPGIFGDDLTLVDEMKDEEHNKDDDVHDDDIIMTSTDSSKTSSSHTLYGKEDRSTGHVGLVSQTLNWLGSAGNNKCSTAALVFSLFLFTQVSRTSSDIFLTEWAANPTKSHSSYSQESLEYYEQT